MKEDAFYAFLVACGYTPKSVASRLSRCRLLERRLHVDLDTLDLVDTGEMQLCARLEQVGISGTIRNNVLNAARTYKRFQAGEPPGPILRTRSALSRAAPERIPIPPPPPRSQVVTDASTTTLLVLYGELLDELRDRGIARTGNGPIGDYAERLFAQAFGWTLAGNATAGHDAEGDGVNYQIKARRLARPNSSRQLGVLRDLPSRHFDVLAAVLFDARFGIQRAALIPFEVVTERATWTRHVNGYRFMLTDQVWSLPDVRDVTSSLADAAATLDQRVS